MAEDLDLNGGMLADVGDLVPAQLPAQHHPGHPQVGAQLHPVQGVDGHLGGAVDGQVGHRLAEHPGHPQVLDDHPVDSDVAGVGGHLGGGGQLPVGEQGVHGQVYLHPPEMAVGNRRGKFVPAEVPGTPAGVELSEAQIDRVCPCAHRGAQGLRASCGG